MADELIYEGEPNPIRVFVKRERSGLYRVYRDTTFCGWLSYSTDVGHWHVSTHVPDSGSLLLAVASPKLGVLRLARKAYETNTALAFRETTTRVLETMAGNTRFVSYVSEEHGLVTLPVKGYAVPKAVHQLAKRAHNYAERLLGEDK